MFLNHLKSAWRNLWKRKGFSLLNVLGLAIGMAACLLILQYVNFEKSYDRFHPQGDDIYRLTLSMTKEAADEEVETFAANHPAAGPALLRDFPQVEDCFRMVNIKTFAGNSVLSSTDSLGNTKTFYEDHLYLVDSSFLTMMHFPLAIGDQAGALTQPNIIVLSPEMAKKYFGDANPLDKVLTIDGGLDFTVSGVLEPMPANTHMRVNALFSFATIPANSGMHTTWIWPEFHTYVKLQEGSDPKDLEGQMDGFVQKYLGDIMEEYGIVERMGLQPLADIHLKSNLGKEMQQNGNEKLVSFLSLIAIIILVIAWVNYVNLSTARSLERASEVGIRKVVGASKGHIVSQFLFESALVNTMAIVLALVLAQLALPTFYQLAGLEATIDPFAFDLLKSKATWIAVGAIFLGGTFLAGMYPAFVLSAFEPVKTLKGKIYRTGKKLSMRHVLVVLQFTASIVLITGTLIVYYQLSFMRSQDLGFNPDQILIVKSPALRDSTFGNKAELLRAEMIRLPGVKDFSGTSEVLGRLRQGGNSLKRKGQATDDGVFARFVNIDDTYFDTYEIQVLSGRSFSREYATDPEAVVLSEKTVRALGYTDYDSIIGTTITHRYFTEWVDKRVIGVVEDISHRSLQYEQEGFMFTYSDPKDPYVEYFSVKVDPNGLSQTMSGIEEGFASIFPTNPFEHFFLDEFFDRQYKADQQFGKVFGLFAGLAIIVACMGLLGLASYIAARRTKEIGIRKVLGASVGQITLLLARQFVILVAVSALVGIPIAWYGGRQWLEQYAFKADLGLVIFIAPVFIVLAIAMLTMALQTLGAARANPIKALRYE